MRILKRLAIGLAILYLVAAALLYFNQEALIFHPRVRMAEASYGDYPEEYVEVEPGVRLHAIIVPAKPGTTAEKVVLYLHGNVGDNGRSLYQTQSLQGLGADLYLVDYRGFGKSEGLIDGERTMTEDFQLIYDHLKTKYKEENIILTGYSLGTGPASYLASNNQPGGVVLVAPYTSLTAMKNEFFWMFPDLLLSYSLNSEAHLAASLSPVRILHGTADELIPFSMSERLAALDPERIRLTPLPGVGHRGAVLNPAFGQAVYELLSR